MTVIFNSKNRWLPMLAIWLGTIVVFVLVAVPAHRAATTLGEPAIVTGYALFSLIVFLALFNLRKRLPMLPLIKAHWWTTAHTIGGILAVALYFLHTAGLWPGGAYERLLALLFYVVTMSGIVGYLIERIYPRRLTSTGVEVIYERIPTEIADIRDEAEQIVLECTKETRSDTVARYYVETFDWYFRRPRFLISHLTGGHKSDFWLERQFANSRGYVNDNEKEYLHKLQALGESKSSIDFHFAAQRLMKVWLLIHLPAAVSMLLLALWHLMIVNIYAL